jgi:transposase
VRLGLLRELSPVVRDALFAGAFPVYAYLYTLRPFRLLKETFEDFWHYRSLTWARAFLSVWTERALRSRIEPMRKVARMLRAHEQLILNWFGPREKSPT